MLRIAEFTSVFAVSMAVVVAPANADIIHVPGDYPTIQEGIDAALAGDEVVVADGTFTGPGNVDLNFESAPASITVRSANGPDVCIIDCESAARAFIIGADDEVPIVIQGFTMMNGLVVNDSGGAISCTESSPTIRDCYFLANTAYSDVGAFPTGSGGAIFSTGGSPIIEDCRFTDNTAGFESSAPGTGFGGAIFFFLGGGSVLDCEFLENLADGPGGFGNGIGGGVFALFANPDFAECDFLDNHAVIAGGGVWLQGTATTDLGDCSFEGNTAQSGGGLAVFEGAATVHDSIFTENRVASDDPLVQQQIGGGAIGCADNVTVSITDCQFIGNVSADGVGGAVSSIGGSTATLVKCGFEGNSALTTGGAVHNGAAPGSEDPDLELPSTMTITDCVMIGNTAEGGGGGASNQHGSTVSMVHCAFDGNTSSTETGAFPTGSGGAVSSVGSTSSMTSCTFSENTAGFAGSAIGTGFGGAVFFFLGDGAVTDCTFTGNVATGPGGFGNGIGGGMFALFASPSIEGTAFNENSAVIAGGGLWLQGSSSVVASSSFDRNTAQSGGGVGIFEATPTIRGTSFTNNSVTSDDPVEQQMIGGGAIGTADTAVVMIIDCFFSENVSVDGVGGAVSTIGGSSATIIDSEFWNNSAGTMGGAVHNGAAPDSADPDLQAPSSTTMINSLVASNDATGEGGGVSNAHQSIISMVNCTVVKNGTAADGGGVANLMEGSTADLSNSIVWGNESAGGLDESQVLDLPGGVVLSYSAVERGWDGIGVIESNPDFVDFEDDDFRLIDGSPCIDAGAINAVPADALDRDENGDIAERIPLDLDGNPRFADDAETEDTGCGEPVVVDMGAFEFQGDPVHPVLVGDVDGNGFVNVTDLLDVLGAWGECDPECCLADQDFSWDVGIADLLLVLEHWTM